MKLLVIVNVVPRALIHFTLMMEAIRSYEILFLQGPHGIASQKTAFFIVNLTYIPTVCFVFSLLLFGQTIPY
jgi:hypothetical protein